MNNMTKKANPTPNASLERLESGEAMLLAELNRTRGDASALAREIGVGVDTLRRAISGERLRPSVRFTLRAYLGRLAAA